MTDEKSIEEPEQPERPAEAKRGGYGWLGVVVAVLFGLFYAYYLWQAVATFFALPAFYDNFGYGAANVPWWLLWTGMLIPPIVFAVAFVIGHRHSPAGRAVVFFVGLAVVAGLGLGVLALESVLRAAIVALPN